MHHTPSTAGPRILPFPAPLAGAGPSLPFAASLTRPILVEAQPRPRRILTPAEALAHDARNTLTTVRLIANLLSGPGVLQAKDAHLPADLLAAEDALGGLIRKLEVLAGATRPAAEPKQDQPARSAGDAVLACLPVLELAGKPKTVVYASAESDLPPMRLGQEELNRVLTNLVKNASEAMPDGGTVRVTVRKALSLTSPAVLIHVSDDGPGIPAFALGQIFEPGWSTKTGTAAEACGLGLAIVRELVEAAGGKVRVASRKRRGTTFELRVPCIAKRQ